MKFLKYLILPFIFFLFIPIVSAETLENIGYINNDTSVIIDDNYGNTITLPRQTINSQNITIRTIIITANYQFSANTDYILELSTPNAKLNTNINVISLRGYGSICNFKSLTDMSIGYPKVRFSCPSDTSYIVLSLSNLSYEGITSSYNFAWNYSYLRRVIPDNNSQDIIDNQNQNTQDIIDNQNQNTQQQIESQKVCKNIDKNNTITPGYLNNQGQVTGNANSGVAITDYFNISSTSTIKVLQNYSSGVRTCFYDTNKNYISCIQASSMTQDSNLNIPSNAYYVRFSIAMEDNRPQFELCTNGNQALNDSVNNLNDTLNDDSTDGVDLNSLGNVSGWLPAGPIDSILLLPINFLSAFNSALSGTCSPLHINVPFIHTDVDIPCISTIFGQINGLTTFWNWVGRIVSIYILIKYFIGLYDYYDKLTTLQVNFIDDFGGGV